LTAGDHQSGELPERYPLAGWTQEDTLAFFLRRFGTVPDSPATPDGYFRRVDGSLSPKRVRFWVAVRDRSRELLGPDASPEFDYCMTEVVHCKSKAEKGVSSASALCAQLHLDRIMRLSPARLVVVLGAKARARVMSLWNLPSAFGSALSMASDPGQSLAVRTLGDQKRLVAYLPHPTGMTKLRTFEQVYLSRNFDLGAVARGEQDPANFGPR
jgi:hypothetical protein